MNTTKPEKKCARCGETKPVTLFIKTGVSTKGHAYYGWCKSCSNAYQKVARQKKGYYHSETYRRHRTSNGYNTYSYRKDRLKRYEAKNPEKRVAWLAVRKALALGELVKSPCFCGSTRVQAHHYNGYSEKHRLDVIWLCDKHHKEAHAK